MAKTNCVIQFGLVDTTMKTDSTLSVTDKQTFAYLDDLKLNFLKTKKYATLEPNQWRADGTFSTMADDISSGIGLWSQAQSDATGVFTSPVVLTVLFGLTHTTKGITLDMSPYEDYASEVNIKWYNGASLLSNVTFYPDSNEYLCANLVTGYNKLVITFNKTSAPYRYLKLKRIVYGEEVTFSGTELVSANLIEEVNPISAEITINTLGFTLQSNDANFSILNPQGIYVALQQLQPISVTEVVDGVENDMGTFYLTEWENQSETQIKMSAVDLIGLMDKTMFKGDVYSSKLVTTLITEIMTSASVPYTIDSSFSGMVVDGWIPYCTHREALQQVCFAIGAMIDTSRDAVVNIKGQPVSKDSHITLDQKLSGGKVTLLPFVTGVELTEHNFVQTTEAISLYNGTLSAGTYTIFFDEPAHTLTITGATIASGGANHAVITVASPGAVVLSGKKYADTSVIITKNNPNLVATDKTNILKVETAYLVSARNSTTAITRIYDYYQKRIKQEFSTIYTGDRVGTSINVDTIYETTKSSILETIEIDLVGGGIQKVVAVGA